jgi:4-diphosphocytidyl-2-C-methyl-D-erythritol kinase
LNGRPGRARELASTLASGDLAGGMASLYNSLEAPALDKFPVLALYKEFLLAHGAVGALMSGSGSTTFALFPDAATAHAAAGPFEEEFGKAGWLRVVTL